jgi:cytochrome c oxidase subunit II
MLGSLFPKSASTFAPQVDHIMIAMLLMSAFMIFLVFGLILCFGIRYRKSSTHSRKIRTRGQSLLEWAWTFASLFIFLGICAWAAQVYMEMHIAPPGASEIIVVGKQWMWKFQHADGARELNELHIPVGTPILLTMTSEDVIHSFFVPAFRIKQDVLPGRYTRTWFEATRPGEYHLFCTQYCGTLHAEMRGKVIAMTPAAYQRWMETGLTTKVSFGDHTLAARGQTLFNKMGCIACHSPNAAVRAPMLDHLYGNLVALSDLTTVTADENYLRESIVNPEAKIVKGYENIMPSYSKQLSEEDLLALIAFIKGEPHGQNLSQ